MPSPSTKKKLYIIGSLRNEYIPELDKAIRKECPNIDPFCEWYGAGKTADDSFKEYHKGIGRTYREALRSASGRHIFNFDKYHLDNSDGAILVFPAGKSCHLEAGYMVGTGKPVYALFPEGEPDDRFELMMQFLTEIFYSERELLDYLNKPTEINQPGQSPNFYSNCAVSGDYHPVLAE